VLDCVILLNKYFFSFIVILNNYLPFIIFINHGLYLSHFLINFKVTCVNIRNIFLQNFSIIYISSILNFINI